MLSLSLSLSLSLPFLLFFLSSPFSLRASPQGAAWAHQSRVELVPWRGETQSAEIWCINMCALKRSGCGESGEGNGAKSPHSASDRRRQHPDSFEVEGDRRGVRGWKEGGRMGGKRGREIASVMEEERGHQLLGIRTKLRESQSDNPLCFHI